MLKSIWVWITCFIASYIVANVWTIEQTRAFAYLHLVICLFLIVLAFILSCVNEKKVISQSEIVLFVRLLAVILILAWVVSLFVNMQFTDIYQGFALITSVCIAIRTLYKQRLTD